jgi:hypothetical protein|tara:strand:- start:767 stop:943 length:177 start_codon:yes stop_codon:yes gene_type:complete
MQVVRAQIARQAGFRTKQVLFPTINAMGVALRGHFQKQRDSLIKHNAMIAEMARFLKL